ncbi:hypothetical protein GCM10025868_42660 [Angustibacter aerolatus]|uniref:FAD/NAD(P)-binding domain-containing protein n=1 Tax=Angustibacter aerolatus TaxID=1162965 RepID=A0ABQ6JQQ3_9ACTN|nr:hypothetical protein GCM10025868_42660 [Angustibacter aerolatus]
MADSTGEVFDVVILGGGSGGYACAFRAAEPGLSVALVERDKLGGTCLHRGCIPTKALLHAAEVADSARDGAHFGVRTTLEGIDMDGVNGYKDSIVGRLYKGLQGLFKAHQVTVIEGEGRLVAKDTVQVGDRRVQGRNVVLATGSYARSLPGLDIGGRIITSDQALTLDHVPASVVVLGGGVIGVEFASVWKSFGADVTIVEALPRLVAAEDESASKVLERAYRKRKIAFKTGVKFSGATQDDDGVHVTLENGETIDAEPAARRRRPRPVVRRARVRGGRRHRRPRLRAHRRAAAHERGERLRRRRPRAGPAGGPPRLRARHLRRRGDRRPQAGARRRLRHPARHLLRPRDRVGRADRGAGPREVRRRPRRDHRVQPRRQRQEPDPRHHRLREGSSARRTVRSSASWPSARAWASRSARRRSS